MANEQIILTAFGIGVAQKAVLNLKALDLDQSNKTSLLGTKVFSNLEIEDGNFLDADGNLNSFQGINVDTVLMSVSQTKNIVTTPVQGRNGTVKEYISDGDYLVEIQGVIVSGTGEYPEEDVNRLVKILQAPVPIRIISEYLDYYGISDLVVTDYNIPQVKGERGQQNFRITLLSDTPIELTTNEL